MMLLISAWWLLPCFSLGTCFGIVTMAIIQINRIREMVDEPEEQPDNYVQRYISLNQPLTENEIGI